MDIRKEWKRYPPPKGYDPTNLTHLVKYFQARRNDPTSVMAIYRDQIWDYCRDADRFDEAIVAACLSIRPNLGVMHHHQSKVPHMARFKLCFELVKRSPSIHTAMLGDPDRNFDWLHDGVERIGSEIEGIGPMTIYDVSVRISGWLGSHGCPHAAPDRIYLHQGCKTGVKMLGLPTNVKSLPLSAFPKELQVMDADDLEDFLCAHLAVLEDANHELR